MPEFIHNTPEMIDPNVFTQHARMKTQQWRHKMSIKPYLKGETTANGVDSLCRYVIAQIEDIIKHEKQWKDQADGEVEYYVYKLEDVASEFEYLIGDEKDTMEDLAKSVDYLLDDLYDVADSKIRLKDGSLQKFLWVGAV